jgi:hypothetical protein
MNQEMTFEVANLRKRVLRTLLRHSKLMEGKLAAYVRRSISDESWNTCVDGLFEEGLIAVARTGFARARTVELTSLGTAEAEKCRAEVNAETLAQIN